MVKFILLIFTFSHTNVGVIITFAFVIFITAPSYYHKTYILMILRINKGIGNLFETER